MQQMLKLCRVLPYGGVRYGGGYKNQHSLILRWLMRVLLTSAGYVLRNWQNLRCATELKAASFFDVRNGPNVSCYPTAMLPETATCMLIDVQLSNP